MSNMSYCRFRNTSGDLADCLDSILQDHMMDSSEAGFGRSMFKEFLAFCRDYDIISSYDEEMIDAIFHGLTRKEDDE